ncbi:MAG: spermidine synthase [Chthoniobacterales bacterium]|nr:spermidine synthase [Chthoniobacterales bacterium]
MRLTFVSALLFVSGSSALLFQMLWLRLSGLVFGNSVWSAALILSSFMAGLALGSALAASSIARRVRPLWFYVALELIVAVSGCLILFELPRFGQWISPAVVALWDQHAVLNVLRFALSFLILLVPATAMGMTLPVLLDDPLLGADQFSRAIGVVYGSNTLGAVIGALAGEAYLVERFGLLGTGIVAAALSCTAAAGAAAVAFGWSARRESETEADRTALHPTAIRLPWRLLFLTFGTGAVLLGLEVVWFRFLRLYVASSSTAFSIMLAVVLVGIACGGLVAGALHQRLGRLKGALPILLLLSALATLASYTFFPAPAPQGTAATSDLQSWTQIASLACALMLPVSFLSGILFPFVVSRVQEVLERRRTSTGLTMLWNTCGAAVGPLVMTFLLLPRIGFELSLVVCGAGYASLAFFICDWRSFARRDLASWCLGGLMVAAVLAIIFFPYGRDETHFANARRPYEADGSKLVHVVEGTADTFQLLQRDFLGEPYYYRLLTNGFSMSSTHPRSQQYMRLFAYLPLALRPDSTDVLQICYGVGVTADAFVRDPLLKRIDIVDISKEVFELSSSYHGGDSSDPLLDPRVTIYVQDGRFFLQASPQLYDIITGEPPPLKVAGTVNLYTQEFFELARDRLKDGGIATFWLPIYQAGVDENKAILRAFLNAFPNASVWAGPDQEWIMLGIKGTPRKVSLEESRRLWRQPRTSEDLARMSLAAPEQLAALFLMDGPEIAKLTADVEPLTDFYPKRLSDSPPNPAAIQQFALPYIKAAGALRSFGASELMRLIWPDEVRSSLEPLFLARESRYRSTVSGSNWLAELDFYLRHLPLRSAIVGVLGSDERRIAIAQMLSRAPEGTPAEGVHDLVAASLARRDSAGAIRLLERENQRGFRSANEFFLLIYLYCSTGAVSEAEALARSYAGSLERDWFVDWLWTELHSRFGFNPPV